MDKLNTISSGLNNLGNTCFFNSILQLLYQCTVFNKLILSNRFDELLINIYSDFLRAYASSAKTFSPVNIVNYVSHALGRSGARQEDAEQYLNYIIDNMIDELKIWTKKNNMEHTHIIDKNILLTDLINNLFTIKMKKHIICPHCNNQSISNDDNNKLYLSIDGADNDQNLNNLLSKYLIETLDDENKWNCAKCNKDVNAIIKREIIKLPKYLIIVLKRYTNNNQKINTKIMMTTEFIFNKRIYYLRGFIHHSGSTNGGHYTYYGNKGDINDTKWYIYNDSSVCEISEEVLYEYIKQGYVYLYVNK